ncbi:hypothetical protein JD844_014797 [Phrynosoma platyrhinos]|uniref:Uncharacterized protein n=1 Tax=Phrynosoma platyrhinos TaxID=52577 RepID=A0ABQ7SS92_PHRPL|nr:hypothetical protein JD844_014797 [Phrynosoma platyrhinos]
MRRRRKLGHPLPLTTFSALQLLSEQGEDQAAMAVLKRALHLEPTTKAIHVELSKLARRQRGQKEPPIGPRQVLQEAPPTAPRAHSPQVSQLDKEVEGHMA